MCTSSSQWNWDCKPYTGTGTCTKTKNPGVVEIDGIMESAMPFIPAKGEPSLLKVVVNRYWLTIFVTSSLETAIFFENGG